MTFNAIFRPYLTADPIDQSKSWMTYLLFVIVTGLLCLVHYTCFDQYLDWIDIKSWRDGCSLYVCFLVLASLIYFFRSSRPIVLLLFFLIPLLLIELFLEGNLSRSDSSSWFWHFNFDEFPFKSILAAFIVCHGIGAFVFALCNLWITRLILLITKGRLEVGHLSDHEKLFNENRIKDETTYLPLRGLPPNGFKSIFTSFKMDRDFWLLRILGIFYLAYFLLVVIGGLGLTSLDQGSQIWPIQIAELLDSAYGNPVLATHSFGKISMMVLLCFTGAFNIGLRFFTSLVLAIGHVISTIFCFYFYYLSSGEPFLLTSGIVDGGMVLLFLWIALRSSKHKMTSLSNFENVPNNSSLAGYIQNLFFQFLTVLFLSLFTLFICGKLFGQDAGSFLHPVFKLIIGPESILVNTLTYFFTLACLSYLCARQKMLRKKLIFNIADPILLSLIGAICFIVAHLITGKNLSANHSGFYFALFVFASVLVLVLFHVLRKLEYNISNLITSLHPSEAANAEAAISTFFKSEDVDQLESLKNLDSYLSNIRGRKRGLVNFPFFVLENIFALFLGLRPRFSLMSLGERSVFLKKYIFKTPAEIKRSNIPVVSNLASMLGLSIRALCSISHLTTKRGQSSVGFIPPEKRARMTNNKTKSSVRKHSINQREAEPIRQSYDYVIIGSGPAGAVAAYTLASQKHIDPSKILLVERGRRNSIENDMNDHEFQMLAKLYKEGGLQQTKKFDMILLQGEALGGTSVINNAVCFKMTDDMKDKWQSEYKLNLDDLDEHYDKVAQAIDIHPLAQEAINQKVREKFLSGVAGYNKNNPDLLLVDPVLVNATNEIGDGMWNIGNKRGRKNSMAQTYIPWAEELGIKVLTNTNALRFYSDVDHGKKWNSKTANRVLLEIGRSELKEVNINKALIVAGGCLASSHFLMRSQLKAKVGQNLCCNYAFPFSFEYDDKLQAYDGTQITVGAIEETEGLIFETYFNPPGSFSLTLPFNLKTNQEILDKYEHHLTFGILFGSDKSGQISDKADPLSGRAFSFELNQDEILKIKKGFLKILEIAKCSGAKSAIIPLKPGMRLDLINDYDQFVQDFENYDLRQSEIVLSSAHPQGGNMMCGEDSAFVKDRVVDEDFKLVDFENVYLLDGSVFPCSIGVNPQWTIMAMSSMAAESIAKAHNLGE